MKLEMIIKAFESINLLSLADKEKSFDFARATRIKFGNNLRVTRPSIQDYIKEKEELVRELGTELKDKGQIQVKPENFEEFQKKNAEMLAVDIDIKLTPIKEAELGNNQIPFEIIADLIESGVVIKE